MANYEVVDSQGDPAAMLVVDEATGAATVLVEDTTPVMFDTVGAAVERLALVGATVPSLAPDGG